MSTPGPDQTPGWYLFRFTNGAIGLQRVDTAAQAPANVTDAAWLASRNLSLPQLLVKYSTTISDALPAIGATAHQQSTLIAQLDAGAGKSAAARWLYIGPDRKAKQATAGQVNAATVINDVSSNVKTKLTGDAKPVNLIPSPISPNVGNSHLSVPGLGGLAGVAVRVLEAVGGVLLLVIALRALLGGGMA